MRPNDLIWNYWVNNYLLGNDPPAFDLLYWNADTTRLPARLHSDFLDLILHNPLQRSGRVLTVAGTPIDLSQVTCDSFIVGGTTDHITPWQACYAATQMLGGRKEFCLSSSGHIQSVINPPGNAKAKYFLNPQHPVESGCLAAEARQHDGSWWGHWRDWLVARSGPPRQRRSYSATHTIRRKQMRPASTCSVTDRSAMTALSSLEVDGQRLRVARRSGRSDMVPLLLINGLGASLELLEPFAKALDDIETIRIDLPGTGGSPARQHSLPAK